MVKKLLNIVVAAIFVVGVGLLVYPSFSNWWNQQHRSQAIASYEKKVASLSEKEYKHLWQDAKKYNAEHHVNTISLDHEEEKQYKKVLDITNTGIMGYVEIPKINVSLPIYHGDEQSILQIAIGHIPGTSLPVGGKGTHCVLSGHRGLPSARLFTDIDQLKKGDLFMLQVMDNTLTYKVDQISTVLPQDTSKMQIDPYQDYCTLVTCTPYGVNTHRLLVRGHRIPNQSVRVAPDLTTADPVIWDICWGVVAVVLLLLGIHQLKKSKLREKN